MTNPFRRTAPAAAAALLCAGLVAGCGNDDDAADPATTAPTSTMTSSTTPTTTAADASTSPTGTTTGQGSSLVYFIAKTSLGQRLVAETGSSDTGESLTVAAIADLGNGPVDPDYRSAVPADTIASLTVAPGDAITVTLSSAKWAALPSGTSAADAKLAVQQIVYTFNAAAGTAKKPLPVHFTLGGKASTYLGQPATATAGKQLQTLSLMNVLSPTDGSTLPASTTTFSGMGSSFEATVAWTIKDASGKTVLRGSTMSAGWMNRLWPWQAKVDLSKLSAGNYTFIASTDDPSGGEGGGPVTDSKTFTIS